MAEQAGSLVIMSEKLNPVVSGSFNSLSERDSCIFLCSYCEFCSFYWFPEPFCICMCTPTIREKRTGVGGGKTVIRYFETRLYLDYIKGAKT